MGKLSNLLFAIFIAAAALCLTSTAPACAAGPPAGAGDYEAFVAIFDDFLAERLPEAWNANFNDPDAPNHGLVDYSSSEIVSRIAMLDAIDARLDDLNVAAWPRDRQSEYLAVRAQVDGERFRMVVSRPWARDPGFYVDQLQRFAFQELPVEGEELERFERALDAVPAIAAQAKSTLEQVAADYADLALHNLTTADGVGHGHPYRPTPPAGVIGWYTDLQARAAQIQPELSPAVDRASAAVREFHDWLVSNRPTFDAPAGVGADRYDWYLRQVKLMPYDGDALILLGAQEWDRLMTSYRLAQHKNRKLRPLAPAMSEKEYARRIEKTDRNVRRFLVDEEIITIPDYVGELDTNTPFIERPDGLNFWEAVQYRDPHPDHLHAVIPGHRFDGLVARNNAHRIRGRINDGARVEGWGVYLEEGMMLAGVLGAERPRVEELMYLFGIFRAARVPADVLMQRNEMTVAEAVEFMMAKTPWLDRNVARVDAEIYLRRPPGYGVGYTIGNLQMRRLLADASVAGADGFVLRDFHDDFMARGRLPVSLLRWEMTGMDDEVAAFWDRRPIPPEPKASP